MSSTASCGTCTYAMAREHIPTPSYWCRRYPPTVTSESGVAAFPIMPPEQWCGEYVAGEVVVPPVEAPTNVDRPYVGQQGDVLSCTMGNWEGEPTAYAYQWQRDGIDVVSGEPTYTVDADDVGATFTCVVMATNAAGSTAAPPSNGVVVVAPAGRGSHA